jgi:cellulose synthase/poly-beta-1,6-N-acetylglucosamine synthase-like glycosyltransferase
VGEPRVGIPAAAATGYDVAKGAVIARLDADSRPGPRWVETVVERMSADAGLDALTGTGSFYDAPRGLRTAVSVAYLGSYYVLCHLALGHTALWGSCMAMRSGAWRAVRRDVVRDDSEVHDDLDLAFRLGPRRRIRLDRSWRVGVSAACAGGGSDVGGSIAPGTPCASTGRSRLRGSGGDAVDRRGRLTHLSRTIRTG